MGYQPKPDSARAIRRWILQTPVDVLADHILAGVDLDDPPHHLFLKPPRGQGKPAAVWAGIDPTAKPTKIRTDR